MEIPWGAINDNILHEKDTKRNGGKQMDLETRITKKLCSFFHEETQDGQEILEYGMQLIVEAVFKTVLMMLVALAIGRLRDYLIFMVVFTLLRGEAGGKHCMTNLGCTSSMALIVAASLFLPVGNLPVWAYLAAGACCFAVCFRWAPSSSLINPITDEKIRRRKKWKSLIIILFWCAAIQFPLFYAFRSAVFVTFLSIILLVILQELTRGEAAE